MEMTNTILEDVKDYLPIDQSVTSFDRILIGYIDGAMLALSQMGSLKKDYVLDEDTTWEDIIEPCSDVSVYAAMMEYVKMDVKLLFDPPTANVANMMQTKKNEDLFRIEVGYGQDKRTT